MTKQRDDDDYLGRKVKMRHPTGSVFEGIVGGILRGVGLTVVDEDDKDNICYCINEETSKELGTTLDAQIDYLLDCIDKGIPFDSLEFLLHEKIITSEEVIECRAKIFLDSAQGNPCGTNQTNLKARCKF